MRLALVDPHALCDRTRHELDALLARGVEVVLLSGEPGAQRPEGLSVKCRWQPMPRDTPALLEVLRSIEGLEAVHCHCGTAHMGRAFWAARQLGVRFLRDHGRLLVELDDAQASGATASPFERREHWARPLGEHELSRIQDSLAILPTVAGGVLDVGCGDGRITNRMLEHFAHVTGYDGSAEALSFVRTETRQGPVDRLPFDTGAFELVTCFEVIEHLPAGTFERCLSEIARVSSRHVVIGVPFAETLALKDIVCDRCGHRFNQSGHLRRFTRRAMRRLVPGYRLVEFRQCGAPQRYYYNGALLWARQRLAGVYKRTPGAVCPSCHAALAPSDWDERNALSDLCDRANQRLRRVLPLGRSHCLARYERM